MIPFLSAKDVKETEIHRQISAVDGQHIMPDTMAFKDGLVNVYDEERSGSASHITEELVQKVDERVK